MPQLRSLRLSHNKLVGLDMANFPRLRTLYADNNAIGYLEGNACGRLENLSLRNQRVVTL
jgi:hypothetical protein